jgi:di/tricarboxylate transporter
MTDFSISAHGIAMLAFTVVAFYMFTRPRIPMVITSLTIIATLAFVFYLFPYTSADGKTHIGAADVYAGFSHGALITICSLMILGRGLVVTGALEPLARLLARLWQLSSGLALLVLLVSCMLLSSLINDTPVVVLMMPVLMGLAIKTNTSPAKTLMPMNCAVLIGGMGTTIGTSTNLLVVSIAADLGVPRFGIFDFTGTVAIAAAFALVYLWLIAPRLLPDRPPRLAGSSPRIFDAVLYVVPKSYADGRRLTDVRRRVRDLRLAKIQRGDEVFLMKLPSLKVQAGDRLYVSGTSSDLKEAERVLGATLYSAGDLEHPVTGQHPLTGEDQHLAEVVVTAASSLAGRTLKEVRFADRFGVVTLAIYRARGEEDEPEQLDRELGDVKVQPGDVLLVQGAGEKLNRIKSDSNLLVLDGTLELPRTNKAPIAVAIMAGVIGSAATGMLPISVASLFGVTLMLLTRCLRLERIGTALSVEVVLLVAASLAIGRSLMDTGGARFLAELFLLLIGWAPPSLVLAALMIFMAILTNFVTNNAAAAVGTPIAVAISQSLGLSPEPFVLAIVFGCNLAYATPMGYQTNLLIMNAAGYEFRDYVRVGLPLVLLMVFLFSILLPLHYHL